MEGIVSDVVEEKDAVRSDRVSRCGDEGDRDEWRATVPIAYVRMQAAVCT